MSETKTEQTEYRVRKVLWPIVYNTCLDYLNQFLIFFSLRKPREFFGIVYDSLTKQPLDPVIIKLAYADGYGVETGISSLNGKYAFLARPGKFKILARKSNYIFPSQIIKGKSDGLYHNLYHGEFFVLEGDYRVIAPNIPMDPVGEDWNQTAKSSMNPHSPYHEYLLKRMVAVFLWFGFFWSALAIFQHWGYWDFKVDIYLILYALVIFSSFVIGRPRLLGEIQQKLFLEDELLLELTKPELVGITMGKASVVPGGRFLLQANPGRYYLVVKHLDSNKQEHVIGGTKIRVGSEGVVNQTIKIVL